jgi:hypothetical protein
LDERQSCRAVPEGLVQSLAEPNEASGGKLLGRDRFNAGEQRRSLKFGATTGLLPPF